MDNYTPNPPIYHPYLCITAITHFCTELISNFLIFVGFAWGEASEWGKLWKWNFNISKLGTVEASLEQLTSRTMGKSL